MSATLLYHIHGIRGYTFVKQKLVPGGRVYCLDCQTIKQVNIHFTETFKRQENLDDTKNESKRLEKALNLSADLSAAYILKEILYDLWEQDNYEEGLNNKIKTLKRQAYGFRDQEYFKLKILAIDRKRYALVG